MTTCPASSSCSVMLAMLVLSGCQRAPAAQGPEREYTYVHQETTGLTSGIYLPGAVPSTDLPGGPPDVHIQFSSDSDRDAVESLGRLRAEVLLPNAATQGTGGHLVIAGVLDTRVQYTPGGDARADRPPYQEFRLTRWYLRAPFVRWSRLPTPLDDEPPGVESADRLRPEDFDGKVPGDLARFVGAW